MDKVRDDHADYIREAALHLKWRRVGKDVLRAGLAELSDAARSGQPLRVHFGSATEFAERFDRGGRLYPGYLLASIVAAASLIVIAVTAFNGLVLRHRQDFWGVVAALGGSIAAAALGFVVGAAIDRRVPADITR